MDTSFLYLFDVIILLYSAFLLMWWVRVKFRGETFPAKLLLPQDLLLEECDKQKNNAAKAVVLEYAHQFLNAADSGKSYKL